VTVCGSCTFCLRNCPGQLSLAIPLWAGTVSTGNSFMATAGEEDGKFWVSQMCWHLASTKSIHTMAA